MLIYIRKCSSTTSFDFMKKYTWTSKHFVHRKWIVLDHNQHFIFLNIRFKQVFQCKQVILNHIIRNLAAKGFSPNVKCDLVYMNVYFHIHVHKNTHFDIYEGGKSKV